MKKDNNINWRTSQPNIGDEIVICVNQSVPVFQIVKWKPCFFKVNDPKWNDFVKANPDWDIRLESGNWVGPRNFEGGSQFSSGSKKEKEFYWLPKEEFLDVLDLL